MSEPIGTTGIGIVVIGRNEGTRLAVTLHAVLGFRERLVYVDSDSSDGSSRVAEHLGVNVLRITEGRMSAARGRRIGMEYLLTRFPDLEFLQFIDGDCELAADWVPNALACLTTNPQVGAVAGQLRERNQHASLLLRLEAIDWDLPSGPTDVVGGISMMRVAALRRAGGWNDDLVAGEELDLSLRIRTAGYTLQRLDCEMCLHDMGLTRLSESWRRSVRTGFAYAQLTWIHGRSGPRRWMTRTLGAIVYGLLLPVVMIVGWAWHWSVSVAGLIGILSLLVRVFRWRLSQRDPVGIAAGYAAIIFFSKTGEAIGVLRFMMGKMLGFVPGIIEYKQPANTKAS